MFWIVLVPRCVPFLREKTNRFNSTIAKKGGVESGQQGTVLVLEYTVNMLYIRFYPTSGMFFSQEKRDENKDLTGPEIVAILVQPSTFLERRCLIPDPLSWLFLLIQMGIFQQKIQFVLTPPSVFWIVQTKRYPAVFLVGVGIRFKQLRRTWTDWLL